VTDPLPRKRSKSAYAEAGVDIDEGNEFVRRIRPLIQRTYREGVLTEIGGFSGFFALDFRRYEDPVLLATTDGVGTKLLLAKEAVSLKGIGVDLVAMCANDLIVYGAEPLFFLDYMAFPRLSLQEGLELMEGIVEGCEESRMALLGGETAEMPGVYRKGAYDLAGFAVGIVERRKIIDGSEVRVGARIIGLSSSGPHSNGFSLIRKILKDRGLSLSQRPYGLEEPLGKLLLEPTRIYVRWVLPLLNQFPILAMAHITGGGLLENLPRVLPRSARAVLNPKGWEVPPIFRFLEEAGRVSPAEMFRVFNMGIGFVLVVEEPFVKPIIEMIQRFGGQAFEIGEIEPRREGEPPVVIPSVVEG